MSESSEKLSLLWGGIGLSQDPIVDTTRMWHNSLKGLFSTHVRHCVSAKQQVVKHVNDLRSTGRPPPRVCLHAVKSRSVPVDPETAGSGAVAALIAKRAKPPQRLIFPLAPKTGRGRGSRLCFITMVQIPAEPLFMCFLTSLITAREEERKKIPAKATGRSRGTGVMKLANGGSHCLDWNLTSRCFPRLWL